MNKYPNYQVIFIDENIDESTLNNYKDYLDQYIIFKNNKPLCSPNGNYIAHPKYRFLQQILFESCEFNRKIDSHNLSYYSLYSIVLDFKNEMDEMFISYPDKVIYSDRIFQSVAGPEQTVQWHRRAFILDFFRENRLYPCSPPLEIVNHLVNDKKTDLECLFPDLSVKQIEESFNPIIDFFKIEFKKLNYFQKAIMYRTFSVHTSAILGYLLAKDLCITDEYADAVMANDVILADISADVTPKQHKECRIQLIQDADRLKEFVKIGSDSFKESTSSKLLFLIQQGESKKLEFKATLRKNLETKQHDKIMTFEVFKTIAAFLNTDGGTLLIGVTDSGEINGINSDNFKTHDDFNKHFHDHLKNCFPINAIKNLIEVKFINYNDKNIFWVNVKQSQQEVFMNNKLNKQKDSELLYVRTGPQSTQLTGTALAEHIKGVKSK